jgi:hypothetical protein
MNMAWPPLRLQAGALGAARDPEVVKRGVVEKQRRGERHQRQAQAAQAQGQERQHHGDDGGNCRADETAHQEVEPEVHREDGSREGPDAGERCLAERQLSRHSRDQRHRKTDD